MGYDPSHAASMLAFDGADPLVRFSYEQVGLTGVFDTGAETTDLWPPFAARFRPLLARSGVAGIKEVRGFGGEGKIPEMILTQLDLSMGGITLGLSPAHVLTARTTANSDWLAGRIGLDVLQKAKSVTIDFRANKLQLKN